MQLLHLVCSWRQLSEVTGALGGRSTILQMSNELSNCDDNDDCDEYMIMNTVVVTVRLVTMAVYDDIVVIAVLVAVHNDIITHHSNITSR
jgi:hypothetical protein